MNQLALRISVVSGRDHSQLMNKYKAPTEILSSNKRKSPGQQRGPTSEQVAPVPCAEDGHELHLICSPFLLPSFIQVLEDMNKVRIIENTRCI